MHDQKILCATDGAPHSERAVTCAVGFAAALQQFLAFITVVNGAELKFTVWDQARIAAGDLPVDAALIAALAKARDAGLTQVNCVRASGGGIAEAVVTYAQKNGYHHIMMGSAARTGAARFLKGSVSQELVDRAHCPVTIVRY